MLSQAIWWSSIALETLLLVRGLRGKLASHYPLFYAYLAFVLFEDLSSLIIDRWAPQSYSSTYWATEFLGVLIGCGVVLEIYRIGLLRYPGAARMARNILMLVFVLASTKALVAASNAPQGWLNVNTLQVEGTLRAVQAVFLSALVALFLFYSIPFRKNLRGILLGYGLFVGARVIALLFVPAEGYDFWVYAYSASYLAALGTWLTHLWSYSGVPGEEQSGSQLETDYQRLASATLRRLQAARGQLIKAVRP
jgi:hypothetical protein